ncbi:hypothetical protein IKG68_02540 [Candidatus Saccharibacteria bacterium]|nr:hypothetical protein [Candidatus Saccharibacteria bacterium]
MKKFLIGATSFYVVAFSTLLLVIIAASFATVILSEVGRSSNDDLSQSAYDSALAGVEDAKLAYSNYLRCMQGSGGTRCGEIIDAMQNPSCDMVAKILGRNIQNGEVMITETTTSDGSQMNQAYTCVKIDTKLPDYRANLTRDNNVRIVKASFERGTTANDIEAIEFSWYTRRSTETLKFTNFNTGNNNWSGSDRVTFTPVGETQPSTPPTMALQMVQTAEHFNLGSYNGENGYGVNSISLGGQTDRATLYLVPTNKWNISGSNFVNTYNGTNNVISAASVAATNDQSIAKKPFVVYCDGGEGDADFVCSVKIYLPRPIGGSRNNDTFMILVTLPYGEPDTDFGIEYLCADGTSCGNSSGGSSNGDGGATISGTQVTIDSTGRANDLFRRVETRLETTDTSFPYTYYALELLGDGDTLRKVMIVTSEHNFYF